MERPGAPPLIVDYKTDRVDGGVLAELSAALRDPAGDLRRPAVAEALGSSKVELAYVFLERPEEPAVAVWGECELEAGQAHA